MAWDINPIFMQGVVVIVTLGQIFVAIKIVLEAERGEQFARMAAISVGLLLFLGSRAFDITFADLMLLAVTDSGLIRLLTYSTVMPALVGLVVAHITISAMNRGNDIAIRIVLLTSVLMLSQISYLNFYAITKTTLPVDKALLPNICYSIAVCLWVVFKFEDTGQFRSRSRY